jgi:hypothetical protein
MIERGNRLKKWLKWLFDAKLDEPQLAHPPALPAHLFDRAWYLSQNPDVAKAGLDPWFHYLEYGVIEGRLPRPNTDS